MISASTVTVDDAGVPVYPHPQPTGDDVPSLVEAFWAYEQALMQDDQQAMADLFAPGPQTIRGDAAGLRVSHEQITSFRSGRGGAPKRRIVELHVKALGENHASTVAVTELLTGGRGQQTQVWQRQADHTQGHQGWQCAVAHVAVSPPACDRRVWKVLGDPLVPGDIDSALTGETVAVKDLFAVGGQCIGAGSPAFEEQAQPETEHAAAVQALLHAGAAIRGIAATDEFAYSLAGTNTHYGVPPNPQAPHRISGGSTSGSASAVSLGHASIGLGTDTGGSIRVPAAYQGLYGLRTTHGSVSAAGDPLTAGALPLAQSFDTAGWLTRSAELLHRVTRSVLSAAPDQQFTSVAISDDLVSLADDSVATAVRSSVEQVQQYSGSAARTFQGPDEDQLATWVHAFTTIQGREAWANHGPWVSRHWDRMAPDVASRFRRAESFSAEDERRARHVAAQARTQVRDWVGEGLLVLPSSSSVAPLIADASAGSAENERARARTLQLTCVAGLAGLPVVSVPLRTVEGLPAGMSIVGPAGADVALTAWVAGLEREVVGP